MSLKRQGSYYLIIGGIQWLLDWAVMVTLTHFGVPIALANIAGRICGALLGYWLNGRFTFAGEDTTLGRTQLQRFVMMWLCTTAASTWAMGSIESHLGLRWAWLAKPGVEAALALVGFLVSRHWVYKR